MYLGPGYIPPDGYSIPIPITNPCSTTTQGDGEDATSTLKISPVFSGAASGLNSGGSTESGFSLGFNTTNGTPTTINGTDPTTNSLQVTTSASNMEVLGSVHTHPPGAVEGPDAGDFYALLKGNGSNADYTIEYIYAGDGTKWALEITNPQAAAAFLSTYPQQTYIDPDDPGDFASGSPMLGSETTVNNWFSSVGLNGGYSQTNGDAFALSYVLSSYNTGVTMLQADANGNYHVVSTVANTSAANTFSKFMCP